VKLALISFSKEDSAGNGPIGLLPLFDRTIAENQVQTALDIGAERIIFLSPAMHGVLLQHVDKLQNLDVEAEIIRSAHDLSQYANDQDELIYFGDGILVGDAVKEQLAGEFQERIFVVENADEHSDYERIDLNHRWLSVASLKASRLAALADIPDDWDIGSALLRTAVQSDCKRELVSNPALFEGAVSNIENLEIAGRYAKQKLSAPEFARGNFLDRYIVWPLMRRALPFLWKSSDSAKYLSGGAMVSGIFAAVAAYFSWPILALALLISGSILHILYHRICSFSSQGGIKNIMSVVFGLIAALVLAVLVVTQSHSYNLWPNLVILGLSLGNMLLLLSSSDSSKLSLIKPDFLLIVIVMLIAAAFTAFPVGLYGIAMFITAYLIADRGG